MKDFEYFEIRYDPNPSGRFRDINQGYWYAKSITGHDGDGLTPQDAMASLIIALAKAYQEDAV